MQLNGFFDLLEHHCFAIFHAQRRFQLSENVFDVRHTSLGIVHECDNGAGHRREHVNRTGHVYCDDQYHQHASWCRTQLEWGPVGLEIKTVTNRMKSSNYQTGKMYVHESSV